MAQQIGDVVSASCPVRRLGDADCLPPGDGSPGFVLASFRFARTVFSVTSDLVITFDADTNFSGFYSQGIVKMTSGPNVNIEREIKSHVILSGRAVVTLQEAFPFVVTVGETGRLEAGCDRRMPTCKLTFTNSKNFRGFNTVPGTDVVLRRGRK